MFLCPRAAGFLGLSLPPGGSLTDLNGSLIRKSSAFNMAQQIAEHKRTVWWTPDSSMLEI